MYIIVGKRRGIESECQFAVAGQSDEREEMLNAAASKGRFVHVV